MEGWMDGYGWMDMDKWMDGGGGVRLKVCLVKGCHILAAVNI